MTDTTTAPGAESSAATSADSVSNTAAPAETVQSAEQDVSPQGEPAGSEQQQETKPEVEEPKPSPAEEARKQRNKERWQAMKQRAADAERRERFYMAEIERLQKQQPDYSRLTDPDDVLAEKTAERLRRGQVEEHRGRAQHEAEQRAAAISEAWTAITDEMRARVPDFDQVVTPTTPIHQRMAQHLVDSDKGGEIAYWLGKNPDAALALYQKFETAPAQAFIELGRIESRLSATTPKHVSTAPKPAPVLNGGSSPPAFDIHKASMDDVAARLKKAGLIR